MPSLPETGLRAVLDGIREFERDAKRLEQLMLSIDESMDQTAESSKQAADVLEASFGDMGQSAEQAKSDLEGLTRITAFQALQNVSGYASQAGGALLDMGKDAAFTAARAEELYIVLDNMAQQNQIAAETARETVAAVKDQGIQTSVAANLVSQFIRAELDLADATNLARVAQDAAVISMEDSSQALAGLLHGIMTLQPEVLRTRGIIVDFQSEYAKFAEETGRTTLSLSGAEKQQIALNAVLAQGEKLTGTYTAAMGSASKQIRSFPRYVAELQEEMGQALLPAMEGIVFTTKDAIKAFKDLPPPMLQSIAVTGTLTGGLLKGGGQAVAFAAQIGQIATAMKALNVAMNLGALGVAGLVGSLGLLAGVGVVTYLHAQEEAHRDEAAAVLASTDSYEVYIGRLSDAELGAYGLTEALFELVKAQEASAQAAYAEALNRTTAELEKFVKMYKGADITVEQFISNLEQSSKGLSDFDLMVLQDRESLLLLGTAAGKTGEELREWADEMQEAAHQTALARSETENYNDFERERYKVMRDVEDAMQDQMALWPTSIESIAAYNREIIITTGVLRDMMQAALDADPAVLKLTDSLGKMIEKDGEQAAIAASMRMVADAARERDDQIAKAEADAAAARLDALDNFNEGAGKLWDSYKKRAQSVYDDIGDAHADLMADLIDAERKAAKDRAKIEADLAKSILGMDAQLAEDRMKAAADLAADLGGIDAKYASMRQEMAESLAESLAEIEERLQKAREKAAEKLQDRLKDIEEQRQKNVESMEQAHQDRLLALAEARAKAAADIERAYQDERQRLLQEYGDLEKPRDTEQERRDLQAELARLEAGLAAGPGADWGGLSKKEVAGAVGRIRELKEQLEKLKAEELAALDERRQQALDELEARAEEEEQALENAHKEALEENDRRAEELREQAQEDYEGQLEDLKEAADEQRQSLKDAHEKRLKDLEEAQAAEIAARRAAYAQELADLDAKHAEEKAKADARTKQALEDLDVRLAEEKARLEAQYEEDVQRLADMLKEEKQNYKDRLDELELAYDDKVGTINEREEEAKEAAETKAEETTEAVITAWENLNPEMARLLDDVLRDAIMPGLDTWDTDMYNRALEIVKRFMSAFEGVSGFDMGSPSKWARNLIGNVAAGAEQSLPELQGVMDSVISSLDLGRVEQGAATLSMPELNIPALEIAEIPVLEVGEVPMLEVADFGRVDAPAMPRMPDQSPQQVSNSRSYELNYTGQPQQESAVKTLFTMMEMASGL